ncbi:Nucleolar pre-ribosomal-associated protein 1, partial [Ophiophagus hannah]
RIKLCFITGLETFIAKAKLLPSNEQYDVVEGYIKVSIECVEIFKLLDGERRPDSEMLLIFQALENILLRTASDLSHFHVVGMNIVKKLINSYMKLIYAALYSETHRLSRLCLTLLSAMVSQGPDAARDVYSHFDFNNKFLPNLVKKRDYKGKPDVRTAYIQYAISFLIAGDHSILVQVLELKDFIPDIIRTGLKEDRISTINLLLSTLETKVVLNKDISKTQKVHFFTSEILNHIASLYRWNGITDVSTVDVKASQEGEEPGKLLVRELVHKFLMNLCCSLKHGINFYDPSLGTSGRGGNLVLLRFLLSLKTAVEDEMVANLMVNIFKVCPDLLNRYFKESQYSFVPRLKSAWLDNMKLLRKIYEAQPDISNAFKTTEFIPLPKLLSMNEKIWEKSEIYTPLIMKEFVQQYREALSKLLPDMTNIIAIWQSFLKQDKAQEGQKNRGTETASYVEETNETNKEHGLDDVEITLLKAVLLQVICLYQQVVPHLVAQSNFDFSKLIKGIFTEKGLQQEISPVLHYHILKLALELPANKFSWFRIQDAAEKVCGEKSVFYLLMKMFVTSPHSQLKIATKKLIFKVLHDSGVFEYTGKELELWLSHLDNTVEAKKEIVIQFLERVLVKVVTNPYPYTDKAADFVQEASILQVNLFKQDVDNISVPISHIDDVLDMIDVLVEDSEGLNEEIGCTLSEDMIVNTFPFSAIVPSSLEARNKLLVDENAREESIVEYLIAVFTDLLHSQRDPLALCLMFQHYDKELQSVSAHLCQFNCYYNLWIPQQAKEALFQEDRNKSVDEVWSSDSSFFTLLKNSYQKGVAVLLEEDIQTRLNEAISQLQPQQLLLALKHVLLYLKTTVENFSSLGKNSGLSLVTVYMDLLKSLLHKGDDTELGDQPEQKNTQIEPELFMEAEILIQDSENDKIMEEMLSLVFKHPILENWFLAIEQHSLPPHSLNPIKVKLLSSHLNRNILDLLKMSCPLLQFRNQLDILCRYFEAITKTVLEELHTGAKEGCRISPQKSLQIEALQELHIYMNTDQLREIMLQLCKTNLTTSKSETLAGKKICLNIHGQTLMQLLTDGYQRVCYCGNFGNVYLFLCTLFSAVKSVLREALWPELLNKLLKMPSAMECLVLSKLLPLSDTEAFTDLTEKLILTLERLGNHEQWIIAGAVSKALETSAEKLHSWRKHLLVTCMKWLMLSFSSNQEQEMHSEVENTMLLKLENLLNSVTEVVPDDWNSFVKLGLKYRYKNQTFLKTLNAAINVLYQKENSFKKRLTKLEVFYMMITQHSLFLSTMLRPQEGSDMNAHLREALVNLLLSLVKLCPAVCERNHFAVLLGAYGATLSISDQKILFLLKLYENNGLSLLDFRGEILDVLKEQTSDLEEHTFQSKGKSDVAFEDLYDPCFLLQLFSELLRPECVVACHKFIEVNALGLTVAALSSYDGNMRAAAYHLLYLMDVVQNGIKQPNLRFTFPLTLYIARVAQQILKPGTIELFRHKMEREWVLAIIGEGLRDKNCYQLYDYQRIFHVILSFFHSPLCDEATQYQILEILQNAAYITKAAYELIRDHSLLTWLLSIVKKRFLENKLLICMISLIDTLWKTNLGNKQTSLSSSSQLELKENQKFLPIQLINEFLHVLLTLLNHIRTNLDPVEFIQFFSVLSSVLEYRTLVIEAFREMGRFIVNEHILSNNDVLILLYKWSIISKDMELQDHLHVVAQQYQIKELLKLLLSPAENTDRNKPWLHSQTSRLAQRKSKIEIEAATISVWKEVYLNECRTLLRSIFIHWEPVLLEISAKSPTEQKGHSNPDLTCKIAYLVFRWLITSFLDDSLNIQNALPTFWWFKKCGFGNNIILDYILKDGTLKRTIFKLYSSICNASETVKLSDLSVFNGIMLHLLESQSLTENNFHVAVKKFCLTEVTDVNKAARIFLTSIYIGDIWLGARQPDMFMTHIKLICGATDTERNDKKRLEFEDSMVSLCKDIDSFLSLHPHFQS